MGCGVWRLPESSRIRSKNGNKYPKAVSKIHSPLRVPVLSSGLLKTGRPSQMPTREHSAPTSAWSCRHCPQDCAPASIATLGPMSLPPGRACAVRIDHFLLHVLYFHYSPSCSFCALAACCVPNKQTMTVRFSTAKWQRLKRGTQNLSVRSPRMKRMDYLA